MNVTLTSQLQLLHSHVVHSLLIILISIISIFSHNIYLISHSHCLAFKIPFIWTEHLPFYDISFVFWLTLWMISFLFIFLFDLCCFGTSAICIYFVHMIEVLLPPHAFFWSAVFNNGRLSLFGICAHFAPADWLIVGLISKQFFFLWAIFENFPLVSESLECEHVLATCLGSKEVARLCG